MSRPAIQNIVSTADLGCKFDLKKIAMHAPNTEYNPKRFVAVIMRTRKPRITALLFSSGKMVCTGAKDEAESKIAARKFARILQKQGFRVKFKDFKIQNMVGSCNLYFEICCLTITDYPHTMNLNFSQDLYSKLKIRNL